MKQSISKAIFSGLVDPEERRLAGILSGVLYLTAGCTVPLLAVLPGVSHAHTGIVLAVAVTAVVWGAMSIAVINWRATPRWLPMVSCGVGLGLIAMLMASSGGSRSPAWIYLFFVGFFASYFFSRLMAACFLTACVVVHALPLLYDGRATDDAFIAVFLIAGPAYLVLGGAIVAGKRRMTALRSRAERLAEQQGALRRVATAVAGGETAERIYERVATEVASLLRGRAAGILRLDAPDSATVIGSWADHPGGRYVPGTVVPIRPGSDVEQTVRTGRPVTISAHQPSSPVTRLGYNSSIVAPVHVADRTWGVLAVAGALEDGFGREDEVTLMEFGDLLATAIANIEDRAKLATQASSDPLTGLANHRSLQNRLAAEAARAMRHGSVLSVAVIDVDHFKQVNDSAGHETGDEMLVRVADCLRSLARAEDTLGRVGGDEFAWVLPDTTREQAMVALERARRTIAQQMSDPYEITVSAGICDTTVSRDPAELVHLADGALYWSKAHGRNQCWIYDPSVIDELSSQERAEKLERSRALVGLRALARAIDAKDAATSRHSERVSELVAKLARNVGWSAERTRMLSEAALVHDVGKIGIPDSLLRKPGPLTDVERAQLRVHAELAARIVEDILSPEQVEWIRDHHERPDGHGYPLGLRGAEIPEGAALMAVADAWDVMTVSRPYGVTKTPEEALEECVSLVGRQFTRTAVAALMQLHAAGELTSERLVSEASV